MQLISVLSLLLVIVQLVMQGQAFRFARSTAIQQLKLHRPTSTTTQFRLFQSTTPTSASPSTVVGRCTQKISDALNPTKIIVTANGDDPNGDHIQILCVSTEFEGKNSVQRQRLVYKVCLIFILSNYEPIPLPLFHSSCYLVVSYHILRTTTLPTQFLHSSLTAASSGNMG